MVSRRRLTHWMVEQAVSALTTNRDTCIVFQGDVGPAEGPVRVVRDGKRWTLTRYLYFRVEGIAPSPAICLLPGGCNTDGCFNPFHHVASRRRGTRVQTRCPHGHEYTPSNIIHGGKYKCRTCYEARKARRRTGEYGNGWCRKGHRLSKKNTYRWVDAAGKTHRRCRRCQLDSQHAYRNRMKENA